jgi:Predicted hydrolases or acyltransferases (alpha/beta hydrolase superfamily)
MSQVKDAAPARMKPAPMPSVRQVSYGTLNVDGLSIAYREAGRPGSPKLVLLHGFPASSHQYRDLVPALADRFHVIAPDYPGFGLSDRPDPQTWAVYLRPFVGSDRALPPAQGLLALRTLRAGLRRAGRVPDRNPKSGRAGVAHHPELQCVRGRLHRRMGWVARRAVEEPGRPRPRHRSMAFSRPRRSRRSISTARSDRS